MVAYSWDCMAWSKKTWIYRHLLSRRCSWRKSKVFTVHNMKVYRGSNGIAPRVRRRVGGSHSRWWYFGEESNLSPSAGIRNPNCPARSLVTISTELSLLPLPDFTRSCEQFNGVRLSIHLCRHKKRSWPAVTRDWGCVQSPNRQA